MESDSDSDFYGDEETISTLYKRVDNFDLKKGWKAQQFFANIMSQEGDPGTSSSTGQLHNAYDGQPGAYQVTESVDDFLSRLPPSTTRRSSAFDWIRLWNPYLPPREQQLVRALRHAAAERLELTAKFIAATKASGMSPARISKELESDRNETIDDLRHLAVMCKVVSGKWMLFVNRHNVDEVWRRVARATANNDLGIAAKVDLADGDDQRLICVYTKDFRDTADITRVLLKLRSLELIRAGGKQIYYKMDAWTELGLYGGNEWQIPASMHSSNEIFAYATRHGMK
ncbi:protein of unknown function (DUF1917) domain containing protein [Naviculisporaceae sp. PSN 640]